jgi:hypothetical protein
MNPAGIILSLVVACAVGYYVHVHADCEFEEWLFLGSDVIKTLVRPLAAYLPWTIQMPLRNLYAIMVGTLIYTMVTCPVLVGILVFFAGLCAIKMAAVVYPCFRWVGHPNETEAAQYKRLEKARTEIMHLKEQVKKYQARERRCECSGLTRTWYNEVKDVVSAPISELITNMGDMTPLKLFVVSIMTLSTITMVNLTFRMMNFSS